MCVHEPSDCYIPSEKLIVESVLTYCTCRKVKKLITTSVLERGQWALSPNKSRSNKFISGKVSSAPLVVDNFAFLTSNLLKFQSFSSIGNVPIKSAQIKQFYLSKNLNLQTEEVSIGQVIFFQYFQFQNFFTEHFFQFLCFPTKVKTV